MWIVAINTLDMPVLHDRGLRRRAGVVHACRHSDRMAGRLVELGRDIRVGHRTVVALQARCFFNILQESLG